MINRRALPSPIAFPTATIALPRRHGQSHCHFFTAHVNTPHSAVRRRAPRAAQLAPRRIQPRWQPTLVCGELFQGGWPRVDAARVVSKGRADGGVQASKNTNKKTNGYNKSILSNRRCWIRVSRRCSGVPVLAVPGQTTLSPCPMSIFAALYYAQEGVGFPPWLSARREVNTGTLACRTGGMPCRL